MLQSDFEPAVAKLWTVNRAEHDRIAREWTAAFALDRNINFLLNDDFNAHIEALKSAVDINSRLKGQSVDAEVLALLPKEVALELKAKSEAKYNEAQLGAFL